MPNFTAEDAERMFPGQVKPQATGESGIRQSDGKWLESQVAEVLDIKNIPWRRVDNYRCPRCGLVFNSNAAGMPDFLLLAPFAFVECKSGKGRLSPEQKTVMKYIKAAGIPYIVCRDSVDELLHFLREGL
jgi:hypothetical protein